MQVHEEHPKNEKNICPIIFLWEEKCSEDELLLVDRIENEILQAAAERPNRQLSAVLIDLFGYFQMSASSSPEWVTSSSSPVK